MICSSERCPKKNEDMGSLDGILTSFVDAGLDCTVNERFYDGGFYVVIISEGGVCYLGNVVYAE